MQYMRSQMSCAWAKLIIIPFFYITTLVYFSLSLPFIPPALSHFKSHMSSAKSSGTAGHGSSTPRRFHSPTFGSPAGIVLRPTRPQSPVPSPSTPTRRATVHDSRRKRVISLTPTSPAARSHVTPTPSSSTPLSSQRASQMPSLDLAERKSSVPLKEFEKVKEKRKWKRNTLKHRKGVIYVCSVNFSFC